MSTSIPQDDGIKSGARSLSAPNSPTQRSQRQLSEPSRRNSVGQSANPALDAQTSIKCILCDQAFAPNSPNADLPLLLPAEKLKQHMQEAHPDVTKGPSENSIAEEPGSRMASPSIEKITISHEPVPVDRWVLNDVRSFTDDYDGAKESLSSLWEEAFDGFERPKAYESSSAAKGEFLPITDASIYTDILKDPQSHPTKELYAITANAANTLKIWQDEYLYLEKLIKLTTKSVLKKPPNPREPEEAQVYEDKKEAMLYGYKYDPKPNQVGYQDPFAQGGFIPTAEQMRKLKASGLEPWQMDNWKPVKVDGVDCVPKVRPPVVIKPRRKPVPIATKPEVEGGRSYSGKRITRFGGSKHPPTREASAAPTEPASPITRTQTPLRQESATPQAPTSTPMRKSARPLAQELASISTRAPVSGKPSFLKSPKSPAPASTATSKASTPFYPNPLLDPKNQLKIMQSKHPKRTEAMILHWAKFNQEGRTRNPKRTKAQIEAAKSMERQQRQASMEPTAMMDRKRKTETTPGHLTPLAKKPRRETKTEPVTPVSEQGDMSSLPFQTLQPTVDKSREP
ncbi:hypothetical protein FQN57_005891 [Myotisia sp. PD_48]|nr:hypothetical protein FQN57_005891 [Myotisia sp. PD_48]